MSKKIDTERADAIKQLRAMLKPGATVNTILRHCSASGMTRVIDLVITHRPVDLEYPLLPPERAEYKGQRDYDGTPTRKRRAPEIRSIGWLAAKAMGDTYDRKREGIKIGGCGMDMGFALVYNLGATLWPNGTPKPHGTRNGEPDNAGGYALKHRWL